MPPSGYITEATIQLVLVIGISMELASPSTVNSSVEEKRSSFALSQAVMDGKKLVFNYPILEKIVDRFKQSVANDAKRQEAVISYDIDEYDERFLRHLALGYTKDMIANLKGMPFGVKSLEKRQNDLVNRLFPQGERVGVNATRLVVRALELRILDIDNLEADDE